MKGAVDTVLASAASKKIDLVVRLSSTPIVVKAEPVRLQQIVWNLISNAIKFTEAGGKVTVITESDGAEAQVIVEDTGIGIDPAFRPMFSIAFGKRMVQSKSWRLGLGLQCHALTKHMRSLQAILTGKARCVSS